MVNVTDMPSFRASIEACSTSEKGNSARPSSHVACILWLQWLTSCWTYLLAFSHGAKHVDVTDDIILGALRQEVKIDDVEQEPIFEDRPILAMRAGHPLLEMADISSAMLSYPWLLPDRATPLRRFWEAMIVGMEQPVPKVAIECGSAIMIRQLLTTGNWLTLLSRDQISTELNAGILAALQPPVRLTRTIGMFTRHDWRPTKGQSNFIASLREVGQDMNK